MKTDKSDPKEVWRLFGPWLRRQREITGKTRKQVAAAIDLHPVQIARIETGESGTKKETLDLFIEELGLNPEEAYRMAGLMPESSSSYRETVEEVLRYSFARDGRTLSDLEIERLRPLMEVLDREIDRLLQDKN